MNMGIDLNLPDPEQKGQEEPSKPATRTEDPLDAPLYATRLIHALEKEGFSVDDYSGQCDNYFMIWIPVFGGVGIWISLDLPGRGEGGQESPIKKYSSYKDLADVFVQHIQKFYNPHLSEDYWYTRQGRIEGHEYSNPPSPQQPVENAIVVAQWDLEDLVSWARNRKRKPGELLTSYLIRQLNLNGVFEEERPGLYVMNHSVTPLSTVSLYRDCSKVLSPEATAGASMEERVVLDVQEEKTQGCVEVTFSGDLFSMRFEGNRAPLLDITDGPEPAENSEDAVNEILYLVDQKFTGYLDEQNT